MNETNGTLEGTSIAVLPQPVERVGAPAGKGLEGDRYAQGCGTFLKNSAQRNVMLDEADGPLSDTVHKGRQKLFGDGQRKTRIDGVMWSPPLSFLLPFPRGSRD